MLFAPLVLPVSQTLMPESCDEPARIVVDVHQPGYTVEFRVCEDEGAPCSCSTDDHSLVIVSARLYSDDLTYNLSYGAETFDVSRFLCLCAEGFANVVRFMMLCRQL